MNYGYVENITKYYYFVKIGLIFNQTEKMHPKKQPNLLGGIYEVRSGL